jgi:hypothetical protein
MLISFNADTLLPSDCAAPVPAKDSNLFGFRSIPGPFGIPFPPEIIKLI